MTSENGRASTLQTRTVGIVKDELAQLILDDAFGLLEKRDLFFPSKDPYERGKRAGYLIGYLKGLAEGREEYDVVKKLIEDLKGREDKEG